MARKSSCLPVTPEISKPDTSHSRRYSMGKLSSSNSIDKIPPHYLRASTGSCHDFCKYGRQHAFEAKTRLPFPKRMPNKPAGSQQLVESEVQQERKKKTSMGVRKPSPIPKNGISDPPIIIKKVVSEKSVVSKTPLESQIRADNKKTSAVKLRFSLYSKTSLSNSKRQEGMSSSIKTDSLKAKDKNSSLKYVSKPKSSSPYHSRGGLYGGRNNEGQMGQSRATSNVASKKVMASPRPLVHAKPSIRVLASPRPLMSPKPSVEVLVSPRASLFARPSLSSVASLTSQKNRTLKAIFPLKNEEDTTSTEPEHLNDKLDQIKDDVVQEKTLYVVGLYVNRMETESESLESVEEEIDTIEPSVPPLSSSPKSLSVPESPSFLFNNEELEEESEYTMTEADDFSFSDSREHVNMEVSDNVEPEYEEMKQSRIVSSEVNHQPVKSHFSRGKVVEFHSENSGPRMLKFRRGRVPGDNQNTKGDARRSFKKRGVDGDKNDGKPDSEKVVLRHQDIQGKKDSQVLFNNVIEETASKLVETRKSKVKALVGAFETVISLQDRKPSAAASVNLVKEKLLC